MVGRQFSRGAPRGAAIGVAMLGLVLSAFLSLPGVTQAASPSSARPTGDPPPRILDSSGATPEAAEGGGRCEGRDLGLLSGRGVGRANCPNLPTRMPPTRSGAGAGGQRGDGGGGNRLFAQVENEAGDRLDVTIARPGTLWMDGPNSWMTDCTLTLPIVGVEYMPCGYVTFYDAGWETAEKAPDTNVVEDAIYDSCGNLVDSDISEGWHVVGTEYTLSGWHASHRTEPPISVPPQCFGPWRLVYTYTQTFSDKETLTASVETLFGVDPGPLLPSARWGGGNPTEMSCSQQCVGDPVNSATGEFYEAVTDLEISGRGPGLQMARTYSSAAARAGATSTLGRGWAFSYDMALAIDPETGDATVKNGNGSRTQFFASSAGFVAPPRVLATLVENEDGTYTYTVKARTEYTFDSSGKLVGISDLNDNEITLSYDEAGRLQTAGDEAGRTFTFSYDEAGLLESVADSTGRSVGYGYDEAGRLDEVTDARGGVERFTYDEEGQLLTRKDQRENVALTNTYGSKGRILTQTDAVEGKTTFAYVEGARTLKTEVTDPRGYLTRYEYESGILARRIDAAGTFQRAEWIYEYDPVTLGLTAVTDSNGHMRRMSYDENGNVTSTEDALGRKTEAVYNSLGDPTESTDAGGVTTTYEYDERGNLLRASTPLVGSEPAEAATFEYAYEDEAHPGDLTAITDPEGRTTHFGYDEDGNLESVVDGEGNETTYEYDERGNRLSEVSPRGNVEGAEPADYTTSFTYDPAGSLLTAVNPLGHERKWSYDPNGNVKTETNPNGRTTTYTYDAANQLTTVERPNGQTEVTAYDLAGNVKSQTDGLKQTTTYKYDPLGNLEASTDPLTRTTSYVYDVGGRLVSSKDPKGRTTTYDYNAVNQLVGVDYSDPATADVEYGYDAEGRRTSMSDGTGESSYEYDSLGRLTSTTDGKGSTVAYDYDLAGGATGITYPNGKTVAREFDDAGRLTSVSDWLGNTTTFAYDPSSNLVGTTFPTGTGGVDEYSYDRADRMSEVRMKKGSETLASLAYTPDPAGQLESLTSSGLPGPATATFGYDLNSRLTQAGAETFAYDAANNLTSAPGSVNAYDAAGQLKASTGVTYSYSPLGERVERMPESAAAAYVSSFGSFGSATGKFNHPAGVEVDAKGNLWVVDKSNHRLQKFDSTGKYLTSFGSLGTAGGQFKRPADVAIDASGNLWVVDTGNNRIQQFSETGKFLAQFGTAGSGNGQFKEPEGIDVDASGNIWVADTYNGRVQAFTNKGKFIRVVGEKGTAEGKISEATDVAIGLGGRVWVSDWNNRVLAFTSEGSFIRQIGGKGGSANGQFLRADTIDVDAGGNVWVGDEGNNRVQKFNESGEFLGKFGTAGSGEGQFSFGWPMGIAVESSGKIWISDTKNSRVQQWKASEPLAATKYGYDQAGRLTSVQRQKAGEVPAIEESYAYDGTGLRSSQTVSGVTSNLVWDQTGELPLLLGDGQASYIYGPGGAAGGAHLLAGGADLLPPRPDGQHQDADQLDRRGHRHLQLRRLRRAHRQNRHRDHPIRLRRPVHEPPKRPPVPAGAGLRPGDRAVPDEGPAGAGDASPLHVCGRQPREQK